MLLRALLAWLVLTAAAIGKPTLLHFKSENCGPCRAFNLAYQRDRHFREWLNRNFELVPAIDLDKHPSTARRYEIDRIPTWLILIDGEERGRVVGYTGAQKLVADLTAEGMRIVAEQRAAESEPRTEEIPDKPRDDPTELNRVLEINRLLQRENRELADSRDLLRGDVESARNRIKAIEQTLEQERAEVSRIEQLKQPAFTPQDSAAAIQRVFGPAETKAEPTGWRAALKSLIDAGVSLGMSEGVSSVVMPVLAGSTPAGLGTWGAIQLIGLLRRRRRTTRVVVDGPSPPPEKHVETQFVQVESSGYRQAHEQARQHIARRYPGSQEVLEAELSLLRQFMAGQT